MLIVDVYPKNVELANLLLNVQIAIVNWKKKDVVAGLVITLQNPTNEKFNFREKMSQNI
ncbi:MAG: hypothetical protein M3Y53_09425 [Thermoproteota archaeon]|nr:hypothetical protein [Thermoproteota archaeon]